MGLFDGGGSSLIDTIARLVTSPGAKYLGGQFKNAVNNNSSGPLVAPRQGFGSSSKGNSGPYGGNFSGIGAVLGSLGKTVNGMQHGPQAQPNDPLMDLYQQLIGQLQEPVKMPTGINTEDLMNQVKKAINPIYDQRAQAAQSSTDRGTGQVKDMYRALSNDYERLAPEQLAQSKAAQEEIKKLYGTLRSNVEGNFTRVSEEQGDLFKQLGIEDALPDVLDQQDDSVNDAMTAASENQAQQQQRYMDMGQADATYYREGSPQATMTGNEISSDMIAQLQQYLNQNNAERTSGIQTGYLDQLGQAQGNLAQQQQVAQQEAGRKQEMLWQMLQSQLSAKSQPQQALTPDTFMAQLPPEVQQKIGGAFTSLQRSPESVYGKVEDKRNPVPGTFVETTPQWYMAQADEMLKRGEIDPTTHQALQMYMQLYFGNPK